MPGVPVIYDANDPAAAEVIRKRAEELGCGSWAISREDTEILETSRAGIRFRMRDTLLSVPFIARYQVMNASLAVQTIRILQEMGQVQVSQEALRKGLSETRWQGRMETILPGVIVDGAHNEDGVRKFVETAAHFQEQYPLTLLFSAVEDKSYEDMIHDILSEIHFRSIVVTQVGGCRQVPAAQLGKVFERQGCLNVEAHENIREAFWRALELKGEDGMLFCVGSLYLVGEIKAICNQDADVRQSIPITEGDQ